ncbi:bacterio-opsin activator domain-containing protein [Halospeciosus flavus]|uniref:Bacterio-opsin activator domain-containing protein n=1 Tax=Halospeciosus flavus TaxID=3032283 RepID=A0ABD5Z6K4_9EURY|nr:bacterio-opsin activator domain-containing protein [Halospeciosus flavus]
MTDQRDGNSPQSVPGSVSVEFRVENESYPFVGASAEESCTFELEEMIPRGDGVYSEFFRVKDADTDRILELAEEAPQVEPTLLREEGDESLFEFEVAGGCIAVSIAEEGGRPRVVRGDDGDGSVIADFPSESARDVVRKLVDDNDGVEVDSHSGSFDAPEDISESTIVEAAHDTLTTRQRGALMTALSEGFYEWPQQATLADVADTLGIDADALDQRLHNCEQELLSTLFGDGALDDLENRTQPLADADVATGE